jgi:hypothetical protein
MRTAANVKRILAALLLIAVAPARADDAAVKSIYAAMEIDIHNEYVSLQNATARGSAGGPGAQSGKAQEMVKTLFYNRAALFAVCAAEVQQSRPADAPRIPAQKNIFLTTCVDAKFGELNTFRNLLGYARAFFPDRIERCGEAARLREREKLLPPYDFLELAEPKLYDFARYNTCLMTPEEQSKRSSAGRRE